MLAARKETIELQGHTDAAPFPPGATRTNWELSFERAAAARKILEAGGVAPARIVGVLGRGASTPLDPAHPYAAKNRRLSVLLRYHPPTAAITPTPEPSVAPAEPPASELPTPAAVEPASPHGH
jgi:chemotaxis protein MotB